MARWRERAFREVRDELDRFLNFPLNQQIALGDFGLYNGKRCRFEWSGNIGALGVSCASAGFQHEIAETYATAGVVNVQGRLGIGDGKPAVDISFRRATALAFRGFKIGFDQAQLASLTRAFNDAVKGGLKWDKKNVIVTQLWRADGFTHLVSGGAKAGVQIEAHAPGASIGFNFADPTLGLQVASENAMSYCVVGQTQINPYFAVHKFRQMPDGEWQLYKYGLG